MSYLATFLKQQAAKAADSLSEHSDSIVIIATIHADGKTHIVAEQRGNNYANQAAVTEVANELNTHELKDEDEQVS